MSSELPPMAEESAELLFFIMNHGKADAVADFLRDTYQLGSTILPAFGSCPSRILRLLALNETQKEILLSLCPARLRKELVDKAFQKFRLDRPGAGIAFSLPLFQPEWSESPSSSGLIAYFCILDKGFGSEAIDLLRRQDSLSATVIPARGSAESAEILFNIPYEPEKDLLLLVLSESKLPMVASLLEENFHLCEAHRGIHFASPVCAAVGLMTEEDQNPCSLP